ncbi:MAG: FAD:protein FMN transferase [Lachnospiraceae bacterium]|nr:FAD:protein FMN transferase [Lachnospiraceae bacterium]
MKRKTKDFLTAFLLVGGLLFFAGCGKVERYSMTDIAMGTVTNQTIYSKDGDLTLEVRNIMLELEQEELSWRIEGSEVAQMNAAAGSGVYTPVSDRLYKELEILIKLSADSGGAFDITIRPVAALWNIDAWAAGDNSVTEENLTAEGTSANKEQPGIIPAHEQITLALTHTGYESLSLTDSAIMLPKDMALDLGAAGKGIACDRIAAYLKEQAVYGAVVSVGGSVVTVGKKPDGTPWQIGIIDPRDTSSFIGILYLEGENFVSTSGDYERYVEVDGVRYHHILNPATGYPADSGVRSVTILCDSGILSDALSTACFVLGVEEGMALAESYGAQALFVDMEGNISMTDGMKQFFKENR